MTHRRISQLRATRQAGKDQHGVAIAVDIGNLSTQGPPKKPPIKSEEQARAQMPGFESGTAKPLR